MHMHICIYVSFGFVRMNITPTCYVGIFRSIRSDPSSSIAHFDHVQYLSHLFDCDQSAFNHIQSRQPSVCDIVVLIVLY